MALIDDLKTKLVNSIDIDQDISDEELTRIISGLINEQFTGTISPVKERLKLIRDLFNSVRGLDILEGLLDDDRVTEIMVNGSEHIFVEQNGVLSRYSGAFSSPEKLSDVIQSIAGRANKRVNESSPILDTRLPDGSRLNVVLPPVSLGGASMTIRKFPKDPITMEKLIALGSITRQASEFLKNLVIAGYNIFISGGTGSGKTTFLNALSEFIPGDERIITIEDSAELQIRNIDNLVRLECRQANTEGENAVTIRDLIRSSLRMRPNRIIVGEVRGAESFDMLQAMNTGHDGSLSTGHANSPRDMMTRLEMMTLTASDMPLAAIRSQIASALDILIHLGRGRGGGRRVMEISEIAGIKDGEIDLNPLFTLEGSDPSDFSLVRTPNELIHKNKLLMKGLTV